MRIIAELAQGHSIRSKTVLPFNAPTQDKSISAAAPRDMLPS